LSTPDQKPLFPTGPDGRADREIVAPGVTLLRGFAAPTSTLIDAIAALEREAPFQHLQTRGGAMSVAMLNCGPWGWYSDLRGYRYVDANPTTGRAWPAIPGSFAWLAVRAAAACGFAGFAPDACLVNRYAVGARMGTHRDLDERDLSQPIVSVSIGLPATFLWYGAKRSGAPVRVPLEDGDVMVWGGEARGGYHGVRPVAAGEHRLAGSFRYNLTFRRAR
jgi:alkylated DNA repair protein (DNA oxidative demethylase)